MLKWLLTLVVAVVILGMATPWLRRLGMGRLPGDVKIERNGREYVFPLGSTILLSLLVSLVYWMLR